MKQKGMLKRILAMFMSAVLLLETVPFTEVHAEPPEGDGTSAETAFEIGSEDAGAAWTALATALGADGTQRADGESEEKPTYYKLTSDCKKSEYITPTFPSGRNAVIDLCGHKIDCNQKLSMVQLYGNLVINDSVGGGMISNGLVYGAGGAIYVGSSGNLTLNGGCITGSIACIAIASQSVSKRGGGICVDGGSFTMNGGSITGNRLGDMDSANYFGGSAVFIINDGSFTMNDGLISENISNNYFGAAVDVREGSFTMNGGVIADNTATYGNSSSVYGAGVSVGEKSGSRIGNFIMNGGEIRGNRFTKKQGYGAGVCVMHGRVTINGGSIRENANNEFSSTGYGGGVYEIYGQLLTLGGNAEICDNGGDDIALGYSGSNSAMIQIKEKLNNENTIRIAAGAQGTVDYSVMKGSTETAYELTTEDMSRVSSAYDYRYPGLDESGVLHLTKEYATISYAKQEGEGSMEAQKVAKGLRSILNENCFTRDGYNFLGWNTKAGGTGGAYTDGGVINAAGDLALYAQWSPNPVVTFVHNGGKDESGVQSVTRGVPTMLEENSFTRAHYNFKEWNTKADGSGISYADKAEVQLVENLKLYAIWEKTAYVVTFNKNDGSGTTEKQFIAIGTEEKLDSCPFTLDHYVFTGWNTKSDGSGTAYSDEQLISLHDDIVLFAKWAQSECVISFNADGGTGSMENQIVMYKTPTKLNANVFTKDGYTFLGWHSFATREDYADEEIISAYISMDMTARWGKNCRVTFEANEGTGTMDPQAFIGNVEFTLNKNQFTRKGYIFDSWNTEADGSGRAYSDKRSLTLNNDITLYAQWEKAVSVSYNGNGAQGTMAKQEYRSGEQFKLEPNSYDKSDSFFSGWNTEADGSGTPYKEEQYVRFTEDVILYAQWKRAVLISFDANVDDTESCEGIMETQKADAENSVILNLNTYTREGYVFGGWNTEADGSGESYADRVSARFTQDTILYAQWRKIIWISFDANVPVTEKYEGIMEDQEWVSGYEYTLFLNTYTREGYEFIGWNTKADGSGMFYGDREYARFISDTKLYAQWRKIIWISFDANVPETEKYEGIMEDQEGVSGYECSLRVNTYIREGYVFTGWNTKADGSGASYSDYQTIAFSVDTVLYAQWSPMISIIFDRNTGDGIRKQIYISDPGAGIVIGSGIDEVLSLRDGYAITGWNTEADGSGNSYDNFERIFPDKSMTLYAKWSKKVKLTLYSDNEKRYETFEIPGKWFDTGLISDEEVSAPEGYVISGWNTEKDGSGIAYDRSFVVLQSDMELYAQYAEEVTLTYYNDENDQKGDVYHYAKGEEAVIIQRNLVDESVLSWNTKADGSGIAYAPESSIILTDDLVLYGQWVESVGICIIINTSDPPKFSWPKGGKINLGDYAYQNYYVTHWDSIITGWNTRQDGKGTAYEADAELTVTEDITLYGQLEEGGLSMEQEDSIYGEKINQPVFKVQDMIVDCGTRLELRYRDRDSAGRGSLLVPTEAGHYTVCAYKTGIHDKKLVASANFSIAPRPVKVSGITAADKEYDGTVSVTLDCSKAVLEGKLKSDELSVKATGRFESSEVGSGKKVIISNIELTGEDKDNYVLAADGQQSTATADIIEQKKEEKEEQEVEPTPAPVMGIEIDFDPESISRNSAGEYAAVYTGKNIEPAVIVKNNGEILIAGRDYTLKYSGNKEVSNKGAAVIISGKGAFEGEEKLVFSITKRSIDDESVIVGNTIYKKGSDASPVVVFNGMILKNDKDYSLKRDGNTAVISGSGNFEGNRSVELVELDEAAYKEKAIKLSMKKISRVYTGEAVRLSAEELVVKDAAGNILKEDTDYIVSYSDNVNAGTVRLTVTAIGMYNGAVSRSFKIKPDKNASFNVRIDEESYEYVKAGVNPVLSVSLSGKNTVLKEGRDYRLAFSSNKKVGKGRYKLTFIGNYKGAKYKGDNSFTIVKKKATENNTLVIAGDMTFKKSGKYQPKVYVIVDGELLAKSDVTADYSEKEKLDGAKNNCTVKLNVKGKKYADGTAGKGISVSYNVVTADGRIDVSKGKIALVCDGKTVKDVPYTGRKISFSSGDPTTLQLKLKGNTVLDSKQIAENFDIFYADNTERGKATVILKAKARSKYVGAVAGTFKIVSGEMKVAK